MKNTKNTGKTLDTYRNLCTEVYELSKPACPSDAYAFYKEYAKAANGPILEPMCGTGRFLLPLFEEGFNIHGFDASPSMLAKLHEKAKLKGLQPHVWQGLAGNLNRPEKYGLIFIPSGSFCLITDEEEVKLMLASFYKHLTDNGILLFEAETLKAVPELGKWHGSVWPKPDGTSIILSQLATFEAGICKIIGKYELIHDSKIIHTEIEEYKIRIYQENELIDILKTAGFNSIRMLKAFDFNQKPSENDESIVYECRKVRSSRS